MLKSSFESIKKQRGLSGLRGIKLLHDDAKLRIHYYVRNFIKSNGVIKINHLLDSLDLAPCDYCLFDYIERRLTDEKDEKSLMKSITKIVESNF